MSVETRAPAPSLRQTLRVGGPGLLAVLATIQLLDYLDSAAVTALAPDLQRSLGLSDSAFALVVTVQLGVFVLAAVPMGLLADRVSRTRLAGGTAVVAGLATSATGTVGGLGSLYAARVVNEAGQSAILPVHPSLLADGYPAGGRARVLGLHAAAAPVGALLGPVVAGGIAAAAGGAEGWRVAFLVLGLPSVLAGVLCMLLREPRRGAAELAALDAAAPVRTEVPVSGSVGVQRLLAIPTYRAVVGAVAVLGLELVAVPIYFALALDRTYDLSTAARGLVLTLVEVGAVAGTVLGGFLGDRVVRSGPGRPLQLFAACSVVFGLLFTVSLASPSLPLLVAGVALAKLVFRTGSVPAYATVAAVVPARLRSLSFSVLGVAVFVGGGAIGTLLTGALSDAYGPRAALALVVLPTCLLAALIVLPAVRTVAADTEAAAADLLEDEQAPVDGPVLVVQGLEVSYGDQQVLFGVDLSVAAGEVVALLGTNGAGKSTLLRAVCGSLASQRGSVRLDGQAVTYADTPARVRLGLTQVPGGKAVFPSMTVRDNLLVGTATFLWERDRRTERLEAVVALFPDLRPLLDQPAGLLSGGEQQMLALAKALLLEPKVLLVDELSLGLAPVVVQQLLQVVRDLADAGTAVVLVEQSVNVALSVADRAVFMEKGTVRFDGPAADLLARDDLLRAVFLGGAR